MSINHKSYPSIFSNMVGVTYECVRCHARFDGQEFETRGRIVCPQCGYRVVKKVRPPIIKRVKTD